MLYLYCITVNICKLGWFTLWFQVADFFLKDNSFRKTLFGEEL